MTEQIKHTPHIWRGDMWDLASANAIDAFFAAGPRDKTSRRVLALKFDHYLCASRTSSDEIHVVPDFFLEALVEGPEEAGGAVQISLSDLDATAILAAKDLTFALAQDLSARSILADFPWPEGTSFVAREMLIDNYIGVMILPGCTALVPRKTSRMIEEHWEDFVPEDGVENPRGAYVSPIVLPSAPSAHAALKGLDRLARAYPDVQAIHRAHFAVMDRDLLVDLADLDLTPERISGIRTAESLFNRR
jgi:hypothetical protein